MAQKDKVLKEKLEHAGTFDFSAFYGYIHSWLKEAGYNITEDKYAETVAGNARDILVEWTAVKDISDYFKIEHKIKVTGSKVTNVKVEIDGEKKEMNKGKIEVEITGNLIKDPENKWEASPFVRFMRDFYNKYIIPGRVSGMKDKISTDVTALKEDLKAYLELAGKR